MALEFRSPEAHEIECRAIAENNIINIFLYCRAETCTQILNETVGSMNWEKEYTNNNRNCIVRIWDEAKQRMISKEDCGGGLTEIDGLKGQASNGFKRVCALGWGLGIELYSQPQIKLEQNDNNCLIDRNGNVTVIEKYYVDSIEYENKKIKHVVIKDSEDNIVYPLDMVTKKETVEAVTQDTLDVEAQNDESDVYEDISERYEYYRTQLEDEIKRVHVRKPDVLKALKVQSLGNLEEAEEDVIRSVLEKIKKMPTYEKAQ